MAMPQEKLLPPEKRNPVPAAELPSVNPYASMLKTTGTDKIERWLAEFHVAFSLMSIIPLLICCYLITVKFFSISILSGMNGVYFLLAVIMALIGLLAGRQVIMRLIRRLVELNAKLARFTTIQADFVNHVAHEFRSPLTIIKGSLENLRDGLHGSLDQDQVEPISVSHREASRLSRLVSDLLDIARMEAGKLRMEQEEVILQDLLRNVAESCHVLIDKRALKLSLDLPKEPIHVLADKDRLTQAFFNLLTNAIKYTEQGSIHVRLSQDPEGLLVAFGDTGRGIAQEDLERVFEKFERSKNNQDKEGSGLGLSISKVIIELHQGRIWAESQLGKGSTFYVRLAPATTPITP